MLGFLAALVIYRSIRNDIRPIFMGMVDPLRKQAQTNAVAWVVGMMLGILSSLGALVEVAQQMHWVYIGIMCKVLGPGLATIVALIKQSPVQPMPPPSTPPLPPPPSPSP